MITLFFIFLNMNQFSLLTGIDDDEGAAGDAATDEMPPLEGDAEDDGEDASRMEEVD